MQLRPALDLARARERALVRAPRRAVTAALVALALAAGTAVARDDDEETARAREYAAKAELLHKVQKYVEWPARRLKEEEPFVLGVYGLDPFGDALEATFAGKVHDGHPIELRRQWHLDGLERLHVLFVPRTEMAALPAILERVRGHHVLVVGETAGFARRGGTMSLLVEREAGLVLEIHVGVAKRERLTIRSGLLKVARVVGDRDERDGERKEGSE